MNRLPMVTMLAAAEASLLERIVENQQPQKNILEEVAEATAAKGTQYCQACGSQRGSIQAEDNGCELYGNWR